MADMMLPKVARLVDISTAKEQLLEAETVRLPTSLVYSNAADYDPEFARFSVGHSHCARAAAVAPIFLCSFPAGTLVLADSTFTTFSNGAFIIEQLAPQFLGKDARPQDLLRSDKPVIDVDEECLLVARFGDGTWGHWLGELLPRAVLAEHAYPGRFKFAVPAWSTSEQPRRGLAHSINESFKAYGITQDKFFQMRSDCTYRFKQLFGVTSVWSDNTIHPLVLNRMRSLVASNHDAILPVSERIALLRKDVSTRKLGNLDEVEELLNKEGFAVLELSKMPFLDQVAAFRHASVVFSILGSEMTGLMYSPDKVKVLSAGPANWGDRFFYPLIQLRDGQLADIRGSAKWTDERFYREAPFKVEPRQITVGLERLTTPINDLAPEGYISVSGLQLPLRLGKSELSIDFTVGGNAKSFIRAGWSDPEVTHRWCIGPYSDMVIPSPEGDGDYLFQITLIAATRPPYIILQKIDCWINGIFAESFMVSGRMVVCCRIPTLAITGKESLHLEFYHPIFVSAKSMGRSEDSRDVSVGFVQLQLCHQAA